MTTQLSPTERSTVRRGAHRASTDRADLHATLDAGLICHLAMVVDGSPRVLPTGYGRLDDTLYLHGSSGARSLREADEVCASVTVVDGVVYSRSMMHHSMNYRSAVVHGRARRVTDPGERWEALRVITEHLAPGSWDHARQPNKKELAATAVIALDLGESSVKIRAGGPGDDAEDVEANAAWAGVLPLHRTWGEPVPAADLVTDLPVPEHVLRRS
ncbi:pyridoxamine 5'-phosphate oxidase family protein [Saccharopolyspora sp. ID03-671]|uniref:pyridoxamine 5'-phosphate oxidase family protein n=1 Tax=Saccharopolyspora sp. ID03-671 TaxID=3073066 RepID=UPI0032502FF9